MVKFFKQVTTVIVCLSLISVAFAEPAEQGQCEINGIDYAVANKFMASFKAALKEDDAKLIASMVAYPLRVNKTVNEKDTFYYIKNSEAFIKHYAELFPEKNRTGIENEHELTCTYQGAMLFNGAVWFNTDNGGKLFAINLP
jgi:hypothetical protein